MTTLSPADAVVEPRPKPMRANILRRVALLVGILLVVFVVVLPRIVDYRAVAAALATLSFTQLAILVVVTAAAFAANAGPARILIPALSWPRAISADIAGRAVVSTIPGPTDIATRFVLYRQWGIGAETAELFRTFARAGVSHLQVVVQPHTLEGLDAFGAVLEALDRSS